MIDDPPASPPPSPLAASLRSLHDAALQMAKRFHAIDDQGRIWCILCNERPGLLPSLTCPPCLEEYRRGRRTGA